MRCKFAGPITVRQCLLLALLALFCGVNSPVALAYNIELSVMDAKGAPAVNAVVYAYPLAPKAEHVSVKPVIVDQIDKEFLPSVTVVPAGTPVNFPNNDDIRHHVYSLSKAKLFELPLYSGKPAHPVVFDKPGAVALGCNIHDWMVAFIYVVDTPHYVKTGKDGKARLEGLEDGEYSVFVWHPWMKGKPEDFKKTVSVAGGGRLEFTLSLKANLRIKRAPVLGGGGY